MLRDLHSFPTRRSSDLDCIAHRSGLNFRFAQLFDELVDGITQFKERQIRLQADLQTLRRNSRDLHWVERCQDRKSTRLNSSHLVISYAVFCLKKKTI